ncbi:MAG: hypothetical protein ABFD96_21415 [Armatimonadia bacterium]
MTAPRLTLGNRTLLRLGLWLRETVPSLTDEQRGKVLYELVRFCSESVMKAVKEDEA